MTTRDEIVDLFKNMSDQHRAGTLEGSKVVSRAQPRKRGRPRKVTNRKQLKLYVDADVLDQFNSMNQEEGISSADKVRELISSHVNGSV